MRIIVALAALAMSWIAALPASAQADPPPRTILVLDASGSMWGQIDGINKIVIAREAIGEILQDIPADQELGLTVYGHRREGDCADIETLIDPGLDTRQAIVDAVNSINPRGRTPMSDAVVAAARQLRHTEEPATVILVSDGIETCDADPCAIAAELEAQGVGFTAHVIGFDVADEPQARAQMQCLAENTGGLFLSADTAEELSRALTQVASAPPPPPPATIRFQAEVAPDGTPPVSALLWTITDADGAIVGGPISAPTLDLELPAGAYRAEVQRLSRGTMHAVEFTVTEGEDKTVTLELPSLAPPPVDVTFEARLDSETGEVITDLVLWRITPSDAEAAIEATAPLVQELAPGAYDISATWTVAEMTETVQISLIGPDPRRVVVVFETPPPQASLVAPVMAVAGSTIEIAWEGPAERNDFIAAGHPDASTYDTYVLTRDGNPSTFRVPSEPGIYELRYILGDGRDVLAAQPLEVTPAVATLIAPETAIAGSTIEIAWEGPGYAPDFIAVAEPGSRAILNSTLTREGNPLSVQMPATPGVYELRYAMQVDRAIIATQPIEVTPALAELTAPETGVAGSEIEVIWTGPNYQNDYIAIARPEDERGYESYTYAREGSPLSVTLPVEPGDYELRYVVAQDRTIIATVPITITAIGATLEAPETAAAGSTIEVAWDGPDYTNDYIAIARPEDERGYENYTYTREGAPLDLLVPTDPGRYEIRYIVSQDRTVLAVREIEVTAVGASLVAPASAPAGSTIEITWEGPDYHNDYISVARPDDERGYETYTYTREGTPLDLLMPAVPGLYELRYTVNQDRQVLATQTIEITPLSVTLAAPETALVGETITVEWQGPDYRNDYVAVAAPEDNRGYENYTYTREGAPADLLMPSQPGTYEIRYVLSQDRQILARATIRVEDLSDVTLSAPETAPAGGEVAVTHTGPDYASDFVAIAVPGDDRYLTYRYTRDGDTLTLAVPEAPGSYELRYYMRQNNRVLATRPIEVE